MTDWRKIDENFDPNFGTVSGSAHPVRVMLWVADGGYSFPPGAAAFGTIYIYSDGTPPKPVAEGYNGNWKITHWAPVFRPHGV